MAAWQRRCSSGTAADAASEPGRSTRNMDSWSGPPPGMGQATAAASTTPSTPSMHARSSSTAGGSSGRGRGGAQSINQSNIYNSALQRRCINARRGTAHGRESP